MDILKNFILVADDGTGRHRIRNVIFESVPAFARDEAARAAEELALAGYFNFALFAIGDDGKEQLLVKFTAETRVVITVTEVLS
ncbi:hypothetical protein [Rhizobium mayense]|uniref:Nitrogen regulatory protein P-II n=1 Tax=Rhizobium mayense TaxID=1312184 RepID=A0ABT7JQ13_9HYPH|nr:hypothetical protein [Rhizobium mayense]MDL2398436.1 hypothetical protein [Rhizobium mayense]